MAVTARRISVSTYYAWQKEQAGNNRWYAVNTLPKREPMAVMNLERQNYRHFMPKIRKTVRHARKTKTVLAPLFPGYLFVELDLAIDQWRSINGTYGVASLIMSGDRPRAVPHSVIEQLFAIAEPTGLINTRESLAVGDTVRIMTGAFANHVGVLAALPDAQRARVLLQIMGGERTVTISNDTLVRSA